MGILLIILSIIGGLIVLFLIIAALTKKDFVLERSASINAPRQEVFDYVKMLKNQEYYSVWVMRDPNIKLVYTGTDGTIGATSAWTSLDKNVGVGEQEIKKIHDGESIETEIRFKKPFQATNYALTTIGMDEHGATKVTSRFSGRSKFPMNIMNLMMDKLVGKDMQTNLDNLKTILEKK